VVSSKVGVVSVGSCDASSGVGAARRSFLVAEVDGLLFAHGE
jgi:hypothetical protein